MTEIDFASKSENEGFPGSRSTASGYLPSCLVPVTSAHSRRVYSAWMDEALEYRTGCCGKQEQTPPMWHALQLPGGSSCISLPVYFTE